MPLPNPDLAIQNIAIELATLHVEDRTAILAVLNERERDIIDQFLRKHTKGFEAFIAESGFRTTYDPSRLSPWLSQRLQAAKREDADMTPLARRALLDSVTKLHPVAP